MTWQQQWLYSTRTKNNKADKHNFYLNNGPKGQGKNAGNFMWADKQEIWWAALERCIHVLVQVNHVRDPTRNWGVSETWRWAKINSSKWVVVIRRGKKRNKREWGLLWDVVSTLETGLHKKICPNIMCAQQAWRFLFAQLEKHFHTELYIPTQKPYT